MFNDKRGYYYFCKSVSFNKLEAIFGEEMLQVSNGRGGITFTTSTQLSVNNRLRENEDMILQSSQGVIEETVLFIQLRVEVLFEINYKVSMLDMLMAFTTMVNENVDVRFTKPVICEGLGFVEYRNMVPVWFENRSVGRGSLLMTEARNVVLSGKGNQEAGNSRELVSLGYMVILTQIGSFVPAESFHTNLFQFLLSKFTTTSSIES